MNRFLLLSLAVISQLTVPIAFAQGSSKLISLDAQWVVEKGVGAEGSTSRLNVRPMRSDKTFITTKVVQGTPNVSRIRLVKRVKDSDMSVPVKLVKTGNAIVVLAPAALPEKDAKYFLFVETGADGAPGIVLRENGTPLTYGNPTQVRIADTSTGIPEAGRDVSIQDNKFDPKGALALLTGHSGSAVASGKLSVNVTEVFWDNWFLQVNAKSDIPLQKRDFAQTFNRTEASLDLIGILPEKNDLLIFGRGSRQARFYGKFDADRAFETIDAGAGMGFWLTMDNAVTRGIDSTLFLYGKETHAPAPSPLVHISYEYMGKVSSGDGTSERVTDVGANRIVAMVNWPFWVARGVDLTQTPLKSYYGIHGLIEVGGTWDLEHSQFLPENRFTLEIQPDDPEHRDDPNYKRPSLVFTYVNGKAAPTFRNVDEILAGLKLPW